MNHPRRSRSRAGGVLVDSPTIAASLARELDDPAFAYRVETGEDGGLLWVDPGGDDGPRTYAVEPNTSVFRRAAARIVAWLPVDWML